MPPAKPKRRQTTTIADSGDDNSIPQQQGGGVTRRYPGSLSRRDRQYQQPRQRGRFRLLRTVRRVVEPGREGADEQRLPTGAWSIVPANDRVAAVMIARVDRSPSSINIDGRASDHHPHPAKREDQSDRQHVTPGARTYARQCIRRCWLPIIRKTAPMPKVRQCPVWATASYGRCRRALPTAPRTGGLCLSFSAGLLKTDGLDWFRGRGRRHYRLLSTPRPPG